MTNPTNPSKASAACGVVSASHRCRSTSATAAAWHATGQTDSASKGLVASYRSPTSARRPDSRIVLVSSSTKRGTPSVLATICFSTSFGSALPATIGLIIASHSVGLSRLMESAVTGPRPAHTGANSGRCVTTISTWALLTRSIHRSTSSRVEGSIQCASSNTSRSGVRDASPKISSTMASRVFCRCWTGLRL